MCLTLIIRSTTLHFNYLVSFFSVGFEYSSVNSWDSVSLVPCTSAWSIVAVLQVFRTNECWFYIIAISFANLVRRLYSQKEMSVISCEVKKNQGTKFCIVLYIPLLALY